MSINGGTTSERKAELKGTCTSSFDAASAVGDDNPLINKYLKAEEEGQITAVNRALVTGDELNKSRNTRLTACAQSPEARKELKEKEKKALKHALRISKMISDHLAQLDARIADYGKKINEFENEHFSEEELKTFDKLPEEEQFKAKQEAMKKKVASGDITQAQYDQWILWNQSREALQKEKDVFLEDVAKARTPEEVVEAVERSDVNVAAIESEHLKGNAKVVVEASIEKKVDKGIVSKITVLKNGFGKDAFSGITPSSNAQKGDSLREKAGDMRADFHRASYQAQTQPQDNPVMERKPTGLG